MIQNVHKKNVVAALFNNECLLLVDLLLVVNHCGSVKIHESFLPQMFCHIW